MTETHVVTIRLSYRKGHLTLWTEIRNGERSGDEDSRVGDEGRPTSRGQVRAALGALGLPVGTYPILRCVASNERALPDGEQGPAGSARRLVEACPLPSNGAAWVARRSAFSPPEGFEWGEEMAYWRRVWRTALELVRDDRVGVYRPADWRLIEDGRTAENIDGSDGTDHSEDASEEFVPLPFFAPSPDDDRVREAVAELTEAMPPSCLDLLDETMGKRPEASAAVRHVLTNWVDYVARAGAGRVVEQLDRVPVALANIPGTERPEDAQRVLRSLSQRDTPPLPASFYVGGGPSGEWSFSTWQDRAKVPLRLRAKVTPPARVGLADRARDDEQEGEAAMRGEAATRSKAPTPGEVPRWFVGFYAEHTDRDGVCVPARNVWLRDTATATAFDTAPELLASELRRAIRKADDACGLIERASTADSTEKGPDGVLLDGDEADRFLTRDVEKLERSGVPVDIPAPLRTPLPVSEIRAVARGSEPDSVPGSGAPAGEDDAGGSAGATPARAASGMESPIRLDWSVVIGGHEVGIEEIEGLSASGRSVLRTGGEWIRVSTRRAALVVRVLRRAGVVELREVLHMGLVGDSPVEGIPCSVRGEGWVGALLGGRPRAEQASVPATLAGDLRTYQDDAYAWMLFLREHGLGGCLALDMGLGKTLTTLASIQHDAEHHEAKRRAGGLEFSPAASERFPTLVIGPATVLYGWLREAQRWTSLRATTHHGPGRPSTLEDLSAAVADYDLVVTTYGTAREDVGLLSQINWDGLALDEAQNVKDQEREQSRATAMLGSKAPWRLALTGTPIENRLEDLWSIMEFLNPGYLGTRRAFLTTYQVPIESGDEQAREHARNRLVRLISPFLYRKRKTDPDVEGEVPEKLEVEVDVPLTEEQAALYEQVVEEAMSRISSSEGIGRKGAILAMGTHLKMVCNHPLQYLRTQGEDGDEASPLEGAGTDRTATPGIEGRSNKLKRLTEMLEAVLEGGERAIVFTQFTSMGELIVEHLLNTLGFEIPFLRGGTAPKEREAMRRAFESGEAPPVLLISLRAGGAGLDLPSARAVFHFDRWWNPAVEDQATDRAVRLGQGGRVLVYKFVTVGTIEERVRAVLERKRKLAAAVVDRDGAGAGEEWITELSDEEIRRLVRLDPASTAAVEGDEAEDGKAEDGEAEGDEQ